MFKNQLERNEIWWTSCEDPAISSPITLSQADPTVWWHCSYFVPVDTCIYLEEHSHPEFSIILNTICRVICFFSWGSNSNFKEHTLTLKGSGFSLGQGTCWVFSWPLTPVTLILSCAAWQELFFVNVCYSFIPFFPLTPFFVFPLVCFETVFLPHALTFIHFFFFLLRLRFSNAH